MPRNSYEINYARLEAMMGRTLSDLEFETVYRLRAAGFMDLVVVRLPDCEETGRNRPLPLPLLRPQR